MSTTSLFAEYVAIRTATAIARNTGTRVVRLSGEDARSAASFLLPSRLHLRDAQARQSLLLDASGRPIADVIVAADDEDYLLLLDGPGDVVAHVRQHARGDVRVEALDDTHAVIDLHGPWAWELAAEVLGADMLALPYLNFFRMDDALAVRAGRTGEFGYHLIVSRHRAEELHARFLAKGADLGLVETSADAIALAGFENWFFDARAVPADVTPVELGLSWRLAPDRDYLGREAVEARRPLVTRRQACLLGEGELQVGELVRLGDQEVGRITRVAWSPARGAFLASAQLDARLTFAGVALTSDRGVALRTMAPPLVDNESLYVDPRRHTYRERDEVKRPARPPFVERP